MYMNVVISWSTEKAHQYRNTNTEKTFLCILGMILKGWMHQNREKLLDQP